MANWTLGENVKNIKNREFRSPIYGVSSIALSVEFIQNLLSGILI